MAKYHISKSGKPAICRATKKCPLGGAESHYASKEEAQAAIDESNEREFGLISEDKTVNVNSMSKDEQYDALDRGEHLDQFVSSDDVNIRRAVAEQGYGHDKLYNDEDTMVRLAIARQGNMLEALANDKDPVVRMEVVKHSNDRTKFASDPDESVRLEVANQGAALEQLSKDPSPDVRLAVARQGVYLNELKNDTDPDVRDEANFQANSADEHEDIDSLRKSEQVAQAVEGRNASQYATHKDATLRQITARHGYGNILRNDPNERVRREVALHQEEHHAELAKDKSAYVRTAVAELADDHIAESMAGDNDYFVQNAVASRGLGASKLADSKYEDVRLSVAVNGGELDKLSKDDSQDIREVVKAIKGYKSRDFHESNFVKKGLPINVYTKKDGSKVCVTGEGVIVTSYADFEKVYGDSPLASKVAKNVKAAFEN